MVVSKVDASSWQHTTAHDRFRLHNSVSFQKAVEVTSRKQIENQQNQIELKTGSLDRCRGEGDSGAHVYLSIISRVK